MIDDAPFDPEPLRKAAARKAARPRRRSEKEIVDEGIAFLRARPDSYARKVHGSQFGNAGEPDVDAVCRGRSMKLECKAPDGGRPTAVQFGALRRWAKAGALTGWFTCLDHVREILDHVDDDHVIDVTFPGCSCPRHQNIST